MMNRRSFLAALCALPIVGKYVPKTTLSAASARPMLTFPLVTTGRGYITVGGEIYAIDGQAFHDAMMKLKYETMWVHRPRLTFADWDRKYQS